MSEFNCHDDLDFSDQNSKRVLWKAIGTGLLFGQAYLDWSSFPCVRNLTGSTLFGI